MQSLTVHDVCVQEPWRCLALKYVGDSAQFRELRSRYVKLGSILIDRRLAKCILDELNCPDAQLILGNRLKKYRNGHGQCNWHGGLCLNVYLALLRGRLDYVKSVWPQLEPLLNSVGELDDNRFAVCDENPLACITIPMAAAVLGMSPELVKALYRHRYVKVGDIYVLDVALREIEKEVLDMVTTKYITAKDIISTLPCDNGTLKRLITTILKKHANYTFVGRRRTVFYFENPPGTGRIKPKYLRAICVTRVRAMRGKRNYEPVLERTVNTVCRSDPVKCAIPSMLIELAGMRQYGYTTSVYRIMKKYYVRVGRIYLFRPIAEKIEREVLSLVDKTEVTPTELTNKLGCTSLRVKTIISVVLRKYASEVRRVGKYRVFRFDSVPQVKEEIALLKQLCRARGLERQ